MLVELVNRAPLETLTQLASASINDRLPHEFIATLNDEEKRDATRACLLVSILTYGRVVPRVFQLQASITMLCRQDSVIIAGTGSGKTLCLLIPILLRPKSISITISLLKRLQTTQISVLSPVLGLTNVRRGIQVLESERLGIRTIAINEDTPAA